MIRLLTLVFTLLSFYKIGYPQAQQYFISDTIPSLHVYYLLTVDGFPTPIRRIREVKYVDNTLLMIESNKMNYSTTSKVIRHIKFTKDRVLMSYLSSSNVLGDKQERKFEPPATLLIIPKGNETVHWINDEDGKRYSAKVVEIDLNGEKKPVIYLSTPFENGYLIQYYMKGHGFWKSFLLKDNQQTTLYQLQY